MAQVLIAQGAPFVSLEEAKAHLRVEHALEDDLITTYIGAATQHVRTQAQRALTSETWDLHLDSWPVGALALPSPPLLEVVEVTYVDALGASQVLLDGSFTIERPSGPQALHASLAPIDSWPEISRGPGAVRVRYKAGYGDAKDVPSALRAAVLLTLGDLYSGASPVSADPLISMYVVPSL